MVFTELVDNVLLAVNGGEFTSEAAVQRPDVESYVPQAAHAVIRNAVFGLKAESRSERAATGVAGVVIDPGFFETYTLDVVYDDTRKMRYADLPSFVQSWPGDAGMDSVFGKTSPSSQYVKVNGPNGYASLGDLVNAMSVYWWENTSTASRLWLPGADDGVCDICVRAALEISPSLGDTRVPIPVGLEALVVQMAVEHFRGQRAMPQDTIVDNKDVNAGMAQQT